jgi:aryl-alcohol dehydrogenase-like predicted oxidoreductase
LDAGINFIDTADGYSGAEEMIGKALTGGRVRRVLATKFHSAMSDDPNHRGNSRRLIREVESSLVG